MAGMVMTLKSLVGRRRAMGADRAEPVARKTSPRNASVRRSVPLLVCQVIDGKVVATLFDEDVAENCTLDSAEDARSIQRRMGRRGQVALVLPKSTYLVRRMTVPVADIAQQRAMIQLEMEAVLPHHFGPFELAWRCLHDSTSEGQAVEAYVIKRTHLDAQLEQFVHLNLRPHVVLPSAVILADVLGHVAPADLLVAQIAPCVFETAGLNPDNSLTLRTVHVNGSGPITASLTDVLRSRVDAGTGRQMRVAWIGQDCPAEAVPDRAIVFEDMTRRFVPETGATGALSSEGILSRLAAISGTSIDCGSESLLPQNWVEGTRRDALVRSLRDSTVLTLATLILIGAGLEIGTWRHERSLDGLDSQLAQIRVEGETAERRLEQLTIIERANVSRHLFHDVIDTLQGATPAGVRYSSVELTDGPVLRLRGHAESLSLPFTLPQRLEATALLSGVMLEDASQARKAGGTIVEFRLTANVQPDSDGAGAPEGKTR